jgi:Domain of unknown function DUF29
MSASNRHAQARRPDQSLYHRDFALWVEEQVAVLRAGDVATLDIANVILELEGLTKRDERALGSQLKRIMTHMLKQRYQPERAAGAGRIRSATVASGSRTFSIRARACAACYRT